eukprot:TRINITY_DN4917_c0_g1_i1.p1 TRINITY_DN4917_c0_g1~~TRINITY_DN4917_c0_g1_i1.p1  ORF type:complete len:857 (-),score=280.18 TRINITY_DN4917_c0_g1_i1:27-2597(-)
MKMETDMEDFFAEDTLQYVDHSILLDTNDPHLKVYFERAVPLPPNLSFHLEAPEGPKKERPILRTVVVGGGEEDPEVLEKKFIDAAIRDLREPHPDEERNLEIEIEKFVLKEDEEELVQDHEEGAIWEEDEEEDKKKEREEYQDSEEQQEEERWKEKGESIDAGLAPGSASLDGESGERDLKDEKLEARDKEKEKRTSIATTRHPGSSFRHARQERKESIVEDRSEWFRRALKESPELLSFYESMRPLSGAPSVSDIVRMENMRFGFQRRSGDPAPTQRDEVWAMRRSRSNTIEGAKFSGFMSVSERSEFLREDNNWIWPIISQYLERKGYQTSRKMLEEELGCTFVRSPDRFDLLKPLLEMGIPSADQVYSIVEDHLADVVESSRIHRESLMDFSGGGGGGGAGDEMEEEESTDQKPQFEDDDEKDREGDNIIFAQPTKDSSLTERSILHATVGRSLKAASLSKLIFLLTDVSPRFDLHFVKTFLLTFRAFTTPSALLSSLIKRFTKCAEEGVDADYAKQVRLRVAGVLKQWIESCPQDITHSMERTILVFAENDVATFETVLSQMLVHVLQKHIRGRRGGKESGFMFSGSPPEPKVSLELFLPTLDLFNEAAVSSEEIARQLTLTDFDMYRRIKTTELLSKSWSTPALRHRSSNVIRMTARFNAMSLWVATQILKCDSLKERKSRIISFVRIAEHLRGLNNFNSLLAIISGLNLSPIHRLRKTFAEIPRRIKDILSQLTDLMDSDGSFKEYREALHHIDPPCVPYVGLFLTDLTFIEDGNSDFIESSSHRQLVNWAKHSLVYDVLLDVQQYQHTPYNLCRVYQIQRVIAKQFQENIDEDSLYSLSLRREPRNQS